MDLLSELENMADIVGKDSDGDSQKPSDPLISQWQQLFGYTRGEATSRIEQHRGNVARKQVSDEHWEMVRSAREADGYGREAYEHEIEVAKAKASRGHRTEKGGPSVGQASSKSIFILKLEGLLDSAAKVQQAAGLEVPLAVTIGTGKIGEASFVTIDNMAKDAVTAWLSRQDTSFAPTLVRVSKSNKALSKHSIYPTLGVDSTLPQHRANSVEAKFAPAQNQYPVWYFFYGNLAVPEILSRRLALSEPPMFTPATVIGAVIKKWRGKYNALLDAEGASTASTVPGWAYLVEKEEHEDALRFYETENYEIVRCTMRVEGRPDAVKGLTFRFVGQSEHLA